MDNEEYYCNFCKNKCPLSNPKCSNGLTLAKAKENKLLDEQRCKICEKRCLLSDLQCSTGRTLAKIKGQIY